MKDEVNYSPKFLNLLSSSDQTQYHLLKEALSSHVCRNLRGKRLQAFVELLASIKKFCIRNDMEDSIRCLVYGICWVPNGIAINTRQFGLLVNKCKSSINGSLQQLGYTTLQNRTESNSTITQAIPFLKDNFIELREWSIRLFVAATPKPLNSSYDFLSLPPITSPAPLSNSSFSIFSKNITNHISQPEIFNNPYQISNAKAKIIENCCSPKRLQPLPIINIKAEEAHPQVDENLYFDDPFCCAPAFLVEDEKPSDAFDDFISF